MKSKRKELTVEEMHEIRSYQTYFHHVLFEAALNGESIPKVAKELENDWSAFT